MISLSGWDVLALGYTVCIAPRFRLYQKFHLEIFPNSFTYRRAYRQTGISLFLPLCRVP